MHLRVNGKMIIFSQSIVLFFPIDHFFPISPKLKFSSSFFLSKP